MTGGDESSGMMNAKSLTDGQADGLTQSEQLKQETRGVLFPRRRSEDGSRRISSAPATTATATAAAATAAAQPSEDVGAEHD